MAPESTDLPRQFGPYELLSRIGQGGMGEVYRARDARKDRVVAIKLLLQSLSGDAQFRARFQREADVAARLNDPHVVPIHDYGEIDGTLFIEMPLIEGRDLASILQSDRLPQPEAVRIVSEIASALDAAHAQGLLHRDVKPGNILLTGRGFAYLTDFGIATQTDQTRLTRTGGAVGSMGYMAPERFEDGAPTAAVDEYALACVLFEAMTGKLPYPNTSTSAIIKAHLFDELPQPSTTGLTPAMDAVVRRGLAKDPAARFPSTGALADAAQRALQGQVDQVTRDIVQRGMAGPAGPTVADPDRTHLAPYQQNTQVAGHASAAPTGVGSTPTNFVPQPGARQGGSDRTKQKAGVITAGVLGGVLALAVAGHFVFGGDNGDAHAGHSPSRAASAQPSRAGTNATGADQGPATVTQYLSELPPSSSERPSVTDNTVALAGHEYDHVLGLRYCYSASGEGSRVSWSLGGKWERFSGSVSPTDNSRDRVAKGELKIYVDNKLRWQSGPMKVGDAPKTFDISVKNGSNLVLATNDPGDQCTDLSYMGLGDAKLTGTNGVAPAPTAE